MNRSLRRAARTARILAGHVGRLRDTLDLLRERLREAVARAVGQAAAGAAQDAVESLLVESPSASGPPADPYYRPSPGGWYDPDRDRSPSWDDDRHDSYRRDPDDDFEEGPPGRDESPAPAQSAGRRWGLALAVGCQAAAWQLRRSVGRLAALKALGVGLASTLAAYVAGPVLVASAGLAGSALALAALSDAARGWAAALFGVGTRLQT